MVIRRCARRQPRLPLPQDRLPLPSRSPWPASRPPLSASRRWFPTPPRCRSARSRRPSPPMTCRRSSTPSPARTSTSSATTSRAPATPPTRCWRASASPMPRPPPSCAPTPPRKKLLEGRAGKRCRGARRRRPASSLDLVARYAAPGNDKIPTQFTRLHVERVDGKLVASSVLAPLTAQPLLASGTVRSSLFAATDDAGIPDAVATQIAEIFGTDIDFRHDLRKGATFSIVYEALARRRRADQLGPERRPHPGGRVRQQEPGLLGDVVQGRRRQGQLLRPRRPEQGALVPVEPARVLARHLGLRDAHAPDPQVRGSSTRASTTARRSARRCASSATASSSSPAGRTATATSSTSSTATTSKPSTPT